MKKQKRTRPREASIKKPEIGGETRKVFTNPKTQIKHKGKSKRSTEYAFWRIETDNKRVCILTLEHDLVWGNRKLYVNGEVGFDSGWKFKLVGELRFTLDKTVCILNMYVSLSLSLSLVHNDKLKQKNRHVNYTNETGYAKRPHFTYELYVRGKFHERLERTKTLSLWHTGEGENAVEIQLDTETMLVYVK